VISTASRVQAVAIAGTSVSRPSCQRSRAKTGSPGGSGRVIDPFGIARWIRGITAMT
jgi:hypothetical protein